MKLIKSMEDLCVYYDHSVRNQSGTIYQFTYGDDGMDATYVENQYIDIIDLNTDEICKKYLFDDNTEWDKLLDKSISIIESDKKILIDSFYNILNLKIFLRY